MIYLKLFWSFFQIGLFSIGGGYAAMPLIQKQVVDINHWLSMGEFVDIITISQMTPGPIAINSATFVGIRITGIGGALVATLGCVLPSCIIVLTIAYFYYKYRQLSLIQGALSGLRPAVVSLIASAGVSILILTFWDSGVVALDGFDVSALCLFAAALFVLRKWKPNPILIMALSGLAGFIMYYLL